MLSVAIILGAIFILFFVGFKLYGGFIDSRLIQPDDRRETPAHVQQDNVDFYPAPKLVLFGHHFSSIAGAGPIIGPIVALMNFGWAAALGWVVLGSVLIGAVHDYTALMVSARNRGASIADVAEGCMGRRAKMILSVFLWITLAMIVAVFANLTAKTLVASPEIVIPTFGIILVAILFGKMVYGGGISIFWGTIMAVGANIALILLGSKVFISLPSTVFGLSDVNFWFIIILVYCAIASILPVQVLLQPRDYISTYNLYACLLLGISAILVVRPEINAPAFTGFNSKIGPLYPILFIIIACGAVSGFHALVSGGTTSKQLNKESDAKTVGFGSMLVEGILAVMTLILVGGGLYWAAPKVGYVDMNLLGVHENFHQGGWILVFGRGFGNMVHKMLPSVSLSVTSMIAMISLNAFILTSTDTATRIARFIVQESLGEVNPLFKDRFVALIMCIIPIFLLGYTNSVAVIWPVFGAANQLIAALAMFVVSAYFLSQKKPTAFTIYPGIFMLVTTIAALCYQAYTFVTDKNPNWLLTFVCGILLVLAIFVSLEVWQTFKNFKGKECKMSNIRE